MQTLSALSPFLFPLISLASGIYVQSIAPDAIIYYCIAFCLLAGALGFLLLRFTTWRTTNLIALCALFFCAGGVVLYLQQQHAQQILNQVADKNLSIIATVTDKHVQLASKPRWKQDECLELSVNQTTGENQITSKTFTLQCFVKHITKIQVGDTILIKNIIIKSPQHQTLSGNPGYGDYLIKEGFLSSIFLTSEKCIEILAHPTWTVRRYWWAIRNATFQDIMTQLSPRTACYFSLIFLGKKDPESTDQLRRTFNFWGLSHYLARSGIHIVLFILIWKFILSFLPVHLTIKRLLLVLICGTYGLLSWTSTPFIRAYYSFLLTEAGRLFNFNVHFFHTLTIFCLLMLLFNPTQLFFLDFQLTFGLTFALGWLSLYMQKNK